MQQTDNPHVNAYVAGGASNVLWAWERGGVTGDEAMEAIQRVFADYREEYGL